MLIIWIDASSLRTNKTSTYVRYWSCRDTQMLEMMLQSWHTGFYLIDTHKLLTTVITEERYKITADGPEQRVAVCEVSPHNSSAGMVLTVLSWPQVYFSWWHFSVMSLVCLLQIWVMTRLLGSTVGSQMTDGLTARIIWPPDAASPWILSIWPIFRAAPRTLQSVRTILSALASERKALRSRTDCLSPLKKRENLLNWSHNQNVIRVKTNRCSFVITTKPTSSPHPVGVLKSSLPLQRWRRSPVRPPNLQKESICSQTVKRWPQRLPPPHLEIGEHTRLRNWPAGLSEWRAPSSLSLCRWAGTRRANVTHKNSLHRPNVETTIGDQYVTTCLCCFVSFFLVLSADFRHSSVEFSWLSSPACRENGRLGQSLGSLLAPGLKPQLHCPAFTLPMTLPLKQAAMVE